jgi:hypothetical protein
MNSVFASAKKAHHSNIIALLIENGSLLKHAYEQSVLDLAVKKELATD